MLQQTQNNCPLCGFTNGHGPECHDAAHYANMPRQAPRKDKGVFHKKAVNLCLTEEFLSVRANRTIAAGFEKPKWISFCETLLKLGYTLYLKEAQKTYSKYITVRKEGHPRFKVRFSNHMPIKSMELRDSCDFFVGRTHTGVRTTSDALTAVWDHFNKRKN